MSLCAISVDLDEIPNYTSIHGLPRSEGSSAHAVYDLALGRLESFARANQLPLTLFAVGADLARRENATALRALSERGHEVGNHSLSHQYDLTRRDLDVLRSEVEEANAAIREAVGKRPVGFRAPGYTITDELVGVLNDAGIQYDSSVFPCPPYFAAKAATLGRMRLKARRSASLLDTPNVLRAPSRPYRMGTPYWKQGGGLLELPVQVTRGLRLPYIGTTLTLAGPTVACWLTAFVIGEPLVNLELHGMDVLDRDDGLQELVGYQPDVRVPKEQKLNTLNAVVEVLRRHGYSFVTLQEAAHHFSKV